MKDRTCSPKDISISVNGTPVTGFAVEKDFTISVPSKYDIKSEIALRLIASVKDVKGTNDKISYAKSLTYNDHVVKLVNACFNVYRHFGLTKPPKKLQLEPNELTSFLDVIKFLEFNPHTFANQSKASIAIDSLFKDQEVKDIAWKIITKKLKVGLNVKGWNKAGYNIPTFDLMLAATNEGNQLPDDIDSGNYVIQPKLDGCRMVVMPGRVAYSRSGNLVENPDIINMLPDVPYVLDGEFYSHGVPFDEISGIFRSKSAEVPEGYSFVCFNVLTKEEWDNQEIDVTYDESMDRWYEQIDPVLGGLPCEFVESYAVCSENGVNDQLSYFWEEGYEGGMIRNTGKPAYMWKRCGINDKCVVKLKKIDYLDAKILRLIKGEGKYEDMMGSMLVEYDDCELTNRVVHFEIGSGFNDKQRKEFWDSREELEGQWIRAKFTELNEDGMPRPPVIFDSIRDGK